MKLSNTPAPQWEYPELTVNILRGIVKDAVEGHNGGAPCKGVRKVGLVGSMARGEQSRVSDVDLMLDSSCFYEDLSMLGKYIGYVLDHKYNKRLDITDFQFIMDVVEGIKNVDEIWLYRDGYERMLEEVIWLYGQ